LSIQKILSHKLKELVIVSEIKPVSSGSINKAYKIVLKDNRTYFCKINDAAAFPHLFRKEAAGLDLLAAQNILKTPAVIHYDILNDKQVLLLEWITSGIKTDSFWEIFGKGLARLHSVPNSQFGWNEENYMGSVLQQNGPEKSWTPFLENSRLQPLVSKCSEAKLLSLKHQDVFQQLYKKLSQIFSEEEKPSLLHGDLWSGNFMCNDSSQPVFIDPAVYFGHRSMDLAMTTLFGGFDKIFYESYKYHFPFPNNYKEQWKVCNLYPLLIHLLLFGKSYLPPIENILNEFA
jgi:fructosamine-3-kinase